MRETAKITAICNQKGVSFRMSRKLPARALSTMRRTLTFSLITSSCRA